MWVEGSAQSLALDCLILVTFISMVSMRLLTWSEILVLDLNEKRE